MNNKLLKYGFCMVVAAGVLLGSSSTAMAQATTTATNTPVTIMVMKHVCGNTIKNESDLLGGQSKNSLQGFVNAELACPTTALPGDEAATSTISAPRRNFDFTLYFNQASTSGSTTAMSMDLSEATYEQHQHCGSEILTASSTITGIASTTCLDASNYRWNVNATGTVTVTENTPPTGYHFGTVLFTPPELMANNDWETLVSATSSPSGQGTIVLNPGMDTGTSTATSSMIMLHVYNFADVSTSTATTTPPTSTTTPPTSTTTPPVSTTTPPTFPTTTPDGISDEGWRAIANAIQRIQDIQSRLVDLLFSLTGR
jgi:hypothetical protein